MIKELREFNEKVAELRKLNDLRGIYTVWENDSFNYTKPLQDSLGESYMLFSHTRKVKAIAHLDSKTFYTMSYLSASTTYAVVKFYKEMFPSFTFKFI